LSAGAGTAFGLVAGWRAGDAVGRVLSVLLDAAQGVPFALMLLVIGATAAPTTPLGMAVTLAVFGWVGFARAARARALTLRREPYIDAARALGQTPARILLQHVAPQLTPTLAPLAAMALPQFVLAESTLAYLGLGLPPPTPTLGQMVAEGQETLAVAPWLLAAPAAVLVALGVAFFLLADGLGEAP
jgi:peptide/nickel transport system permease protein